jgi:hypothetical protein
MRGSSLRESKWKDMPGSLMKINRRDSISAVLAAWCVERSTCSCVGRVLWQSNTVVFE